MANSYFNFKQFKIQQDNTAMKVTTDSCLFGAWCAAKLNGKTGKCLDIGTGTGLLALMLAQKTKLQIDAVEIDRDAAKQARENVLGSPFKVINVIEANIKDAILPDYDHIICNPPFYEGELNSPEEKRNTAHHSKDLSLKELFAFFSAHLTETGRFYLLLPIKRNRDLVDLLEKHLFYANETVYIKQSENHSIFRMIVEGSRQRTETIVEELSIRDVNENYTARFIELLKDYYLYL